MATTTNYSWTTPDDTALVKDGAAAIRTLGSSADTTVKNLNPGTTAGDIDYYTSSTAKARVGIGTAGQVLTVNSGATAPVWAAASAPSFVGCSLYSTTNQSIANNSFTAINFDAENYDTSGFHNNVTNNTRITIPAGKGGYYSVYTSLVFASNATGLRVIRIYINGVGAERNMVADDTAAGGIDFVVAASRIVYLDAGDYIEAFVYQTSGAPLNLYGQSVFNFQISYLGA